MALALQLSPTTLSARPPTAHRSPHRASQPSRDLHWPSAAQAISRRNPPTTRAFGHPAWATTETCRATRLRHIRRPDHPCSPNRRPQRDASPRLARRDGAPALLANRASHSPRPMISRMSEAICTASTHLGGGSSAAAAAARRPCHFCFATEMKKQRSTRVALPRWTNLRSRPGPSSDSCFPTVRGCWTPALRVASRPVGAVPL
jgi:hypothetical protein